MLNVDKQVMPWGARPGFGIRATRLVELEFAHEHGFDFVDLDFNRRDEILTNGEALLARAADLGIGFTAHGAGRMYDAGTGFQDTIEDLAVAAPFSPLSFTVHPIMHPFRFTPEELAEKVQRLMRLAAAAAPYGIVICVENIIEDAPHFAAALAQEPALGLTLDIGHAQLLAEENKSYRFLEQYFDRIVHVHVHDNRGGNTVQDDLHLEVGQGTVDFPRIVGELVKRGYRRTFLFEIEAEAAVRSRNRIARMCGVTHVGLGLPTDQ